jgi:tRNA1(Val) A37 N6-methylase TrmN6
MQTMLYRDEKIEDLQCGGLKIIVRRDGFHYGTDSVLLANFAKARKGGHIVELCSGSGAVSILLSEKTRAGKITGVEIRESLADMSNRSAEMNGIGDRVKFIRGDLRNIRKYMGAGTAGTVAVNPPYFSSGSGPSGPDAGAASARHETDCTLRDVTGAAEWLLGPGGLFYIVYRPERLVDLFYAMRDSRIEPKEITHAGTAADKPPALVLVRGKKGAAPGLRDLAPILIQTGWLTG